jgi:hypothetical protein
VFRFQNDDSGPTLPPHMLSTSTKMKEKELFEMKNVDEKNVDEVKNKTGNESPVFQNKMVGSWTKVNAELRKQMLNLEDFKDSEVVLTVKPIGFRKLSSETRLVSEADTASTVSSELEKKEPIGLGGFTNDAFEGDDSEDYTKPPPDTEEKPFQETHFGSWRNIDEEVQKRLNGEHVNGDQVDGEPNEKEVRTENEEAQKEFHSSTLRLDAPLSDDGLSAKMEFGDDSDKEDSIYEQLDQEQLDSDPLGSVRERVMVDTVGATTLEFNNSRESSMI